MNIREDAMNGSGVPVPPLRTRRFETIDIAKAMAIILVVAGHFTDPRMPEGFEIARKVIYMFHMPLFMFASGFIYLATLKPVSYREFISRKFRRLMIPYFVTSFIVFGIKIALAPVMPLENPVTLADLAAIFYSPAAGYFLWFIWALWWMMMIIPFFNTPVKRGALLALAVILFFFAPVMPDLFCIKEFAGNLVYFAAGTVVCDFMRMRHIDGFGRIWQVVSLVLFAVMAWVSLAYVAQTGELPRALFALLTAFVGIAMGFGVARLYLDFSGKAMRAVAFSIASASYIIYLLHTTCMGFPKSLMNKLHFFDGGDLGLRFGLAMVVLVACGVVIPWFFARYVFPKFKATAFLFGLPYHKPEQTGR